VQDAIDQVLEGTRTGERPLLGDVPDQDQRDVEPLGRLEQRRGRLTHGTDAAGGGTGDAEGLHRVDHAGHRSLGLERRQHALERWLGEHRHRQGRLAESLGSPPDLRRGLLAGDVEDLVARFGDVGKGHSRQRALADPRRAAEEDEGTRHEPASEHPVELGDARADRSGAPP
jgi:hypothetical protein